MKTITVEKAAVEKAVAVVASFVPSKESEFAGALEIAGSNGKLTIATTNFVETIKFANIAYVSDDITDSGFKAITLEAKKLLTVIKRSASSQIKLELNDGFVTVKSGRVRAKIETMEKKIGVKFASVQNSIDIADLVQEFPRVLHAVAINNPQYQLNGILVDIQSGFGNIVATDAKRMAIVTKQTNCADGQYIIPRSAAKFVASAFGDKVEIKADETLMQFSDGDLYFETKLINAKYPDWRRIVPNDHAQVVEIEAEQLKSLVREASLFHEDIKINIEGKTICLSDLEGDVEVKEELGESIKNIFFGVNANYMLDMLESMEGSVAIKFNSSEFPIVFEDSKLKEIVMPIAGIVHEENSEQEAA